MKVCVVGCGAVGSIFATHLAQLEDVEVFALDLDRAHVDAINERGLRLSGSGELLGRLRAATDPAELPRCDYGIVATKSMHTAAAIEAAAGLFDEESAVCSVQNGIGNEEILAERVSRVIRGTTFPAGRLLEPGHVAWDVSGDTWIGPFEPSGTPLPVVERLAGTLTRSGMRTIALEDARGAQWTKAIFNAATNPIGALTGLTHGRVCELPPLRALVSGLVREATAVAAAQGIELDKDPEAMIDHAADVAYEHRASMLQDVEARRQTEVGFLNGAIVRLGAELGIPTPLNGAVAALIEGVEHLWTRG